MTSGIIGSPPESQLFVGLGFYKSWSGTDGKYELDDGGLKRTKWNNYNVQLYSRKVDGPRTFQVIFDDGISPPSDSYIMGSAFDTGVKPTLSFDANDQLGLLSKLADKVKGSSFNLAVELSQMRQTVDMVSSNFGKMGKAIMALSHGDFANAARQLGARPRGTRLKAADVPGRWLELQYGWIPLLSDIYDSAKTFEQMSNGPRKSTFRVQLRKQDTFEGSVSPTLHTCKYVETLIRSVQFELAEELSAVRTMGLLDPLSVIWENIPYSFVVDWAFPIGTYLDDLNVIPYLNGRFCTTDVKRRECDDNVTVTGDPWPGRKYHPVPGQDSTRDHHREVRLKRVVSAALDVPLPKFDLSGAIHGKRFWNALSLAAQRFLHVPGKRQVQVSIPGFLSKSGF